MDVILLESGVSWGIFCLVLDVGVVLDQFVTALLLGISARRLLIALFIFLIAQFTTVLHKPLHPLPRSINNKHQFSHLSF